MASIYSDVGNLTSYPTKIDARPDLNTNIKKDNIVVYNISNDIATNIDLEFNVDFQDYAVAGDVNVLQDIVMAIERTLGINPQGNTYHHVRGRLEGIESSIVNVSESIKNHKHLGTSGNPSKIDLTKEVFGLLPKANINLNSSSGGLTASDIKITAGSNISINDYISSFIPSTAGSNNPITGSLYVQASSYTQTSGEWDAASVVSSGSPDLINDSLAFLQKSYKISYGNYLHISSGSHKLRPGLYIFAFRIRKNLAANVEFRLGIGTTASKIITNEDFVLGQDQYNVFYLAYEHKPVMPTNSYYFRIENNVNPSNQGDIFFDSVVITPLHSAVIDLGTVI